MDKVIINGELYAAEDAQMPMQNKDMQLGLSVFETMLAMNGSIDGFDLHMIRFQTGLQVLGLEKIDSVEIDKSLMALLVANDLCDKRAKVRITAMGELYWIEALEVAERSETCSVVLSEFILNERSLTAGVKCGSYANNFLALNEAHQAGADEVIFLNTVGEIAEAATANVFLIKGDVLITPHLESGCLPGVTRELVMHRASEAGIKVQGRAVSLEELLDADEVFLTNTQIGVQAVERIGELEMPTCPGVMTQLVRKLYLAGGEVES